MNYNYDEIREALRKAGVNVENDAFEQFKQNLNAASVPAEEARLDAMLNAVQNPQPEVAAPVVEAAPQVDTQYDDVYNTVSGYKENVTPSVTRLGELNSILATVNDRYQDLDDFINPSTINNWLEDYFKQETGLPYGDKDFNQLSNDELNQLRTLLTVDAQRNPNKLRGMVSKRFENERNSIISNIRNNNSQIRNTVEDFKAKQEANLTETNRLISRLNDQLNSLEVERTTVGTEYERAREILNQQEGIRKQLSDLNADSIKYSGLSILADNYLDTLSSVDEKLSSGNYDLNNDFMNLDEVSKHLNEARNNDFTNFENIVPIATPAVEAPVVEEPVVETPVVETPVEPVVETPVVETPVEPVVETVAPAAAPEVDDVVEPTVEEPVKAEEVEVAQAEEIPKVEGEVLPPVSNVPQEEMQLPAVQPELGTQLPSVPVETETLPAVEPKQDEGLNLPQKTTENKGPVYTSDKPGINITLSRATSDGARKVIKDRQATNKMLVTLGVVGGLVAFGVPAVGFGLLPSVAAGLTVAAYGRAIGDIHALGSKAALERTLNKVAKTYRVRVRYDYDDIPDPTNPNKVPNPKVNFTTMGKDGKVVVINSFKGLENHYAEVLAKEGLDADEIRKKLKKADQSCCGHFKRATGLILDDMIPNLAPIYDRFGGVVRSESMFSQRVAGGKEYLQAKKQKLQDLIKSKDKFNLTREQEELINQNVAKYEDMIEKSEENSKRNIFRRAFDKAVGFNEKLLDKLDELFEEQEVYEDEFGTEHPVITDESRLLPDNQNVVEHSDETPTAEAPVESAPVEEETFDPMSIINATPIIKEVPKQDSELDHVKEQLIQFADEEKEKAINELQTNNNLSEEDRQTLKTAMNVNIQSALESGDMAYHDKLVQEYYEQFPEERPVQENGYGMSK